jgi:hypothetical protein
MSCVPRGTSGYSIRGRSFQRINYFLCARSDAELIIDAKCLECGATQRMDAWSRNWVHAARGFKSVSTAIHQIHVAISKRLTMVDRIHIGRYIDGWLNDGVDGPNEGGLSHRK